MIEEILQLDLNKCDIRLKEAFDLAIKHTQKSRYEFITPEILLFAIAIQEEFKDYAKKHDINHSELVIELLNYNVSQDKVADDDEYSIMASNNFYRLIALLDENLKEQAEYYDDCILSPVDVVYQIYNLDDSMAKHILCKYLGEDPDTWRYDMDCCYDEDMLDPFGLLDEDTTDEETPVSEDKDELPSDSELFQRMMTNASRMMGALGALDELRKGGHTSEPKATGSEPWEELVTCINDTYTHHNPLIGRKAELDRTIRILCRKDKNNPLFIGEPGVGKTAMIYGLTKMIEDGDVPQWLLHQRIYALDMSSIMAGASYHGEFEKRMKMVLEGAYKRGNCILYIDEIHNIMDAGGGNSSINAAEMLKPYLEDGRVRFIGCTTYQDYNKSIANKKAIARRFANIDIKEPTTDEAVEIITALLPRYEQHHGVKYSDDAVRYAVEQSNALINDRFLPDKAIDIIDEAGALLQQSPLLNKSGKPKAARFQKVDKTIIKQILTDVCRISAKALASEDNDELKDLDGRICHDIYGQDEAIRQVVRAVMMSKAGLTEPGKPIASLLFVGPTGVGKTEVCRVLAREMGIELVRFDMSEYTEKHTISKLIGSPAGYVGYDEGGLLTDAIRKSPNCVLLLDEIEKAHSDIYNILLQVMDYARLTDNKGNKADFKNVILVMTSNAGAQYANQASVGFGGGQSKGEAMLGTVRKTFKPEFLNRLSGTVVFNEMDRKMASLILDKKLRELSQRLAAKSVTMDIAPEAYDFLLEKGFTDKYGAREIDRVISQHLTPLLMQSILFGKLKKGGKANIIRKDNGLALNK